VQAKVVGLRDKPGGSLAFNSPQDTTSPCWRERLPGGGTLDQTCPFRARGQEKVAAGSGGGRDWAAVSCGAGGGCKLQRGGKVRGIVLERRDGFGKVGVQGSGFRSLECGGERGARNWERGADGGQGQAAHHCGLSRRQTTGTQRRADCKLRIAKCKLQIANWRTGASGALTPALSQRERERERERRMGGG